MAVPVSPTKISVGTLAPPPPPDGYATVHIPSENIRRVLLISPAKVPLLWMGVPQEILQSVLMSFHVSL